MKTLLIGLSILGLTNLAHAQNDTYVVNHVQLKEIEATPNINPIYFKAVHDKKASQQVELLETEVEHFDITKSPVFTNTFDNYSMLFQTTNGSILASYDEKGKLLNCVEKFENVLLPEKVLQTLQTDYPDWTLNKTTYRVNYYQGENVKKVYQVQIKNGEDKMNLKIDDQGLILNHRNHNDM